MTVDLEVCALVAVVSTLAALAGRLRAPLGADEGYLWYGVQQVLRGRVPHRDFKAYEPGRYLWLAVFARLFGPGLGVLRAGTHLFFALGLFAALVELRELGLGWLMIVSAAALLATWSLQHKQFEPAWLLVAWAAIAHALQYPVPANFALAAATVGFSLLFGFNLLLYSGGAFVLALVGAWLEGWFALDARVLLATAAWGLAGAVPFLLMLLSPQLARRFYERRIASVLSRRSANLPLPLPWPWRRSLPQFQAQDAARRRALQWVFAAVVVVPFVALGLVPALPEAAPARGLLAAAALGLFASHHAASRGDISHISQAISPLCLVALLLASACAPALAPCVVAFSFWLAWPWFGPVSRNAPPNAYVQRVVGGLRIATPTQHARLYDAAEALCAERPGDRAGLLAAPLYPAMYAVLSRDSPVYDTFCAHPSSDRLQQEMIDSIDRAALFAALVSDATLDGREDLRFSRTSPRVWAHLCERMQRTARPDLGRDVYLFAGATPGATSSSET